jgi:hypothetical protein
MMNNMGEGEPSEFERGPESIPTSEEVLSVFQQLVEGQEYKERRKLSDEKGLYLWDIVVPNGDGEIEYSYMRKG